MVFFPVQTVVDLDDVLGLAVYRLRDCFRLFMWKGFLGSKRHEVAEVSGEVSQRLVLSADWNSIRDSSGISLSCPAARGVACGALLSPACMDRVGAPFPILASGLGVRFSVLLFRTLLGLVLIDPIFRFNLKMLWMPGSVGAPFSPLNGLLRCRNRFGPPITVTQY